MACLMAAWEFQNKTYYSAIKVKDEYARIPTENLTKHCLQNNSLNYEVKLHVLVFFLQGIQAKYSACFFEQLKSIRKVSVKHEEAAIRRRRPA